MEKQKKFNYVIICGLLVAVIMMSIGYASLAQTLKMEGTATIKSASSSWNVYFSNVTPDQGNTASWTTSPTISTDTDNTGSNNKITFACELVAPGDWCSTTATIKNGGSIEEMIQEAKQEANIENAKRYFQAGGTVEIALKVFPVLTEEELIKGVNILYEACFCGDINDKSQELVTSRSYGRYKDYILKIVGCMSDVSVK